MQIGEKSPGYSAPCYENERYSNTKKYEHDRNEKNETRNEINAKNHRNDDAEMQEK